MTPTRAPAEMQRVLSKLVDSGLLNEREDEAFRHMQRVLASGGALTPGQKSWAREIYNRLELDSDECLNLYSAGKVPDGIPMPKTERELAGLKVQAHRPLKPPRASR